MRLWSGWRRRCNIDLLWHAGARGLWAWSSTGFLDLSAVMNPVVSFRGCRVCIGSGWTERRGNWLRGWSFSSSVAAATIVGDVSDRRRDLPGRRGKLLHAGLSVDFSLGLAERSVSSSRQWSLVVTVAGNNRIVSVLARNDGKARLETPDLWDDFSSKKRCRMCWI